jgi:catechol 2,3-dioxygenase-like lactoylglutathione lyase family enzyme
MSASWENGGVHEDGQFWAAMVPELVCANLVESLAFYTDFLGFQVRFSREGFVYLERGPLQIMLEQAGQHWSVGPLNYPYGRGINLQMEVPDASALSEQLVSAGVSLFRPLQEVWYRAGHVENGVREFLVQDRDGYLLRFLTSLGQRQAQDV